MDNYWIGFSDAVAIALFCVIVLTALALKLDAKQRYRCAHKLRRFDLRRARTMNARYGRACRQCAHYRQPGEDWSDCTWLGGKVASYKSCEQWSRRDTSRQVITLARRRADTVH